MLAIITSHPKRKLKCHPPTSPKFLVKSPFVFPSLLSAGRNPLWSFGGIDFLLPVIGDSLTVTVASRPLKWGLLCPLLSAVFPFTIQRTSNKKR